MRRSSWMIFGVVMLWSVSAMAANTVVLPSMSVAKGQTGVVIPIMLTNDVTAKSILVPLVFREQTPGAFVTSITMDFGDRLPAGGPISAITFRNQYAEEDGICKDALPGGFGTITSNTGGPNPVVASPEGVFFVRQKLFESALPPGTDATGSMILTVDVTNVDGVFEIDTTCTNPANHLLFIEELTNASFIPEFTKGIITVGTGAPTNNPPTAVCQDVTVEAGPGCEAAVTTAQVDNGSFDPDSDPLTFVLEPAGPFTLGVTNVLLIVADDSGDADTCTAVITVEDTTPPMITSCPGDIAVECSEDVPPPDIGLVTATDNCSVTITHVGDESDNQSCPETILRTYRATDASGNSVECVHIITVQDTQNPVLTGCPGDLVVSCLSDVPPPADVTASDNCAGVTLAFTEEDNATANPCGGTIVRTWTAVDLCDNSVTCTQTITVNDTEPPVVTCSGDIDVTVGPGETEAIVDFASTVTDNCGEATISCVPPSGSAFPVGSTTVVCTGTDQCGNTAECAFIITVTEQSLPPEALCQDIAVDADANCQADASIDNGSFDPDGGAVTLSQNPPGPYPLGATNVVLTVTDDEGDVATCTATVLVEDNTPPTITCPPDIVVEVGEGETGANVDFASAADDNCGVPVVDCDHASGDFFPVGTTIVTCTATDDAGNTADCSFAITVNQVGGNEPPVAVDDDFGARTEVPLWVVGAGCLTNDFDPDGGSLSAILNTDVSHGTLALSANGSFIYTPNSGYAGLDQFTYFANDGSLNSTTPATVTLHVKLGGAIVPGDYDEDGYLTTIDMAKMIDALWGGGPDPHDGGCDNSPRGDLDGDGYTTSLDFARLTEHLFAGGPGPVDPCAK